MPGLAIFSWLLILPEAGKMTLLLERLFGKTHGKTPIFGGFKQWLSIDPTIGETIHHGIHHGSRQQLHGFGVRVLRMGLCSAKEPYSLEPRWGGIAS